MKMSQTKHPLPKCPLGVMNLEMEFPKLVNPAECSLYNARVLFAVYGEVSLL